MSGTTLYAITDTKGSGRIVGIFDDRERAERIRNVDRAYFKLVSIELNAVNPIAIDWLLSEPQRRLLQEA